jgi:hypothetical protein
MDDFNRALFDRAKSKYNRAQFEDITIDEWCALVEGLNHEIKSFKHKNKTQL